MRVAIPWPFRLPMHAQTHTVPLYRALGIFQMNSRNEDKVVDAHPDADHDEPGAMSVPAAKPTSEHVVVATWSQVGAVCAALGLIAGGFAWNTNSRLVRVETLLEGLSATVNRLSPAAPVDPPKKDDQEEPAPKEAPVPNAEPDGDPGEQEVSPTPQPFPIKGIPDGVQPSAPPICVHREFHKKIPCEDATRCYPPSAFTVEHFSKVMRAAGVDPNTGQICDSGE